SNGDTSRDTHGRPCRRRQKNVRFGDRVEMRVTVFSTKSYDRQFLSAANIPQRHELHFLEPKLNAETAALAAESDAVCIFVNDKADAAAIGALAELGVRAIVLRCAGFNNVDLAAAAERSIRV